MNVTKFLTVRQAAQAVQPLPVSPKTIRNYIRAGKLIAFRQGRKNRAKLFVSTDSLEAAFSLIPVTNP